MQHEKPRPVAPERHFTIAFDGACKGNPVPGGYSYFITRVRDEGWAEAVGCGAWLAGRRSDAQAG